MSDYETRPRKMKRLDIYYIPGQTEQLSKDVHDADAAGISYGKQIGRKKDKAEEEYFQRYGHRRRHA